MQSFLAKVANSVISKHHDLSKICFVLPSKRAKLFLKTEIVTKSNSSSFLPIFLTIEEFVQTISELTKTDSITSIFEFYKIYKKVNSKNETDSFDIFSKWSNMLLQDFNDLDSNLIASSKFLKNIYESRKLENWNLGDESTKLTNNYLKFLKNIEIYYSAYKKELLSKKMGYNGLLYRIAQEKTAAYIKSHQNTYFVFAGFNALNKAEEKIILQFLNQNKGEIYWDNDRFYEENNIQAGTYFKKFQKKWHFYTNHDFNWTEPNFNTKKNIFIYGVPKGVSQIKKVGSLLKTLNSNQNIEQTAVILGNEQHLPVLLNSLPKEIHSANITMGYALHNIPISNLFDFLFKMHLNSKKFEIKGSYYYKEFLKIIRHPSIYPYYENSKAEKYLKQIIYDSKVVFITQNHIDSFILLNKKSAAIFSLLFKPWRKNIKSVLDNFILIIENLKANPSLNILDKEYLFRYLTIFKQLVNFHDLYGYINNTNTLFSFYKHILRTESLSFQGEPLKGLQIMGLLESRTLDFENVIITSVNEGFIPMGKKGNSFIPFDLKIEHELPTSKENDAIFAYHFFRLFHRSKNIYLLYNTETDDYGSGEQSRFITQIEIAKKNGFLSNVNIDKKVLVPKLKADKINLNTVEKNPAIIDKLKEMAIKGFSPSSLALYIRNPIDFYKRKILKLKEFNEVEENVASNTFGTIIHDTLENLYTPFKNKFISKSDLLQLKSLIKKEIKNQFKNHYSTNSISSGKNYLAFEIAIQYVLNFVNFEISELEKGKKIKILELEKNIDYKYQPAGFNFPIRLHGKIDRVDILDGVMRIIDYKTGKVENSNLKIKDWSLLCTDEKYSKSFQVLSYAFMLVKSTNFNLKEKPLESGIISFKNLSSGFMKINGSTISSTELDLFQEQFEVLLKEIFNPNNPFIEKELEFNY